jgi:regulatory protein YycI of two-component signal transduction system YycFG
MDKNKLILPITILVVSIILGGFYYVSQSNKQQSIEKQQQMELQLKQSELKAKKDTEEKLEREKGLESIGKSACVNEATQSAVDLNKAACDRGEYSCIKGENMYLVGQYDNIYRICLQRKGLK